MDMDDSSLDISVIVPVLNEGPTLRELHDRIVAEMKKIGATYEIIFVDDGSSDDTNEILKDLSSGNSAVGFIRHFRNHGKSLALMQGFDAAKGEIAVTMDGDLQDEPENIGILVEKLRSGGWHLVSGCRVNRNDPASKKMVSWFYNKIVGTLFGMKLKDVNSGMKAYSRELYKRFELRGDLHRLMPVIANNNGFKTCETPVSHSQRKSGKSKYMLLRYRGLLDIVSVSAQHSTQLRAFHIFGGLGFLSLLSGFAFLFIGLFSSHTGGSIDKKELLILLAAQTMIVVGVVLCLIGLLAEMFQGPLQVESWRSKLIKDKKLPEKDRLPEQSPQE